MSIEDKLQQLHENYLNAKQVVQTAESSATKKVALVPYFRRLFPALDFQNYLNIKKSQQSILQTIYCENICKENKECRDQCGNYYKNALADGHEYIRKVQKDYKNATLDDDEE